MYRVLAVLLALLLVGGLSFAYQMARQEQPGPEYIDKVYELTELVRSESSLAEGRSRSPLDPRDVGLLDGNTIETSDEWLYVSGSEDPAIERTAEFASIFSWLATGNDLESCIIDENPVKRARVRATAACHDRIQWFLDAMRSHVRARVEVEILRLPGKPATPVLGAREADAATGAQVATARIRQGGIALFEQLTRQAVVYDFNQSAEKELDLRQIGELFEGETWRVAAVALADGRIRLQAAHARATEGDVRTSTLPEGPLELPALRWQFTPGTATVENGGALALDCGDRHYLVRVRCDTALPHLSRDDGQWKLLNPAGAARAGAMAGRWMIRPIGGTEERNRLLPQHDDLEAIDSRWNEPHYRTSFAHALESIGGDIEVDHAGATLRLLGPLVLREVYETGRTDPETFQAARARLDAALEELTTRTDVRAFEVAVFRLGTQAALPEGVVEGRPSNADVALLRTSEGAQVIMERTLAMELGQVCDVADLRLRNFLAEWHPHGQESQRRWQPAIDTDVSGWQLRIGRDSNDRTLVRFGLHELAAFKVVEGTGGMKGRDLESPEGTRTQATLSFVAKAGEWASVIQPLGDDARVVVCVRVVQP